MLASEDALELHAELLEYATNTGCVLNISSNFDKNIRPLYTIGSTKPVDFISYTEIYEINIEITLNTNTPNLDYHIDIEKILLPYGFIIASASIQSSKNYISANLHAIQTKEPDDVL